MLHWREPTGLLPFDELGEGDVDERKVFSVRSDRIRSQSSGAELTIDRLLSPDWANVVALADEGDGPFLVCVRQYRFGSQEMSLEIPAGLVDAGEDARTGALRELREETGFVPEDENAVVDLGFCHPNAAVMTNRMTSFFVPRALRKHALDLDEHEEIEVVGVPLSEVDEVVRTGAFRNAAVLVALYRWRMHEAQA